MICRGGDMAAGGRGDGGSAGHGGGAISGTAITVGGLRRAAATRPRAQPHVLHAGMPRGGWSAERASGSRGRGRGQQQSTTAASATTTTRPATTTASTRARAAARARPAVARSRERVACARRQGFDETARARESRAPRRGERGEARATHSFEARGRPESRISDLCRPRCKDSGRDNFLPLWEAAESGASSVLSGGVRRARGLEPPRARSPPRARARITPAPIERLRWLDSVLASSSPLASSSSPLSSSPLSPPSSFA